MRRLALAPFVLALSVAACGTRPSEDEKASASSSAPAPIPAPTPVSAPMPAQVPVPADAHVGARSDTQAATAQADANLRASYRDCIDASGGETPAMQNCIADEYAHHDARLNAAYRSLRAALPAAEADALRTAQREWIERRDRECAWDAATEGQAQRLAANECLLRMTAVRADALERMRVGDDAGAADAANGHG